MEKEAPTIDCSLLLENINDIVQCVDSQGRFIYINKKWKDILGYSEKEIKKLNLFDIIHKSHHKACSKLFEEVKKGKKLENVETIFLTKKGKEIPVRGSVSPINEGGKFISTCAIFHDISEIKESENEFKEIFENAYDAIAIHEPNTGRVLNVNKKCLELFGYTKEEMLGTNIGEVSAKDQEHSQKKAVSLVKKALKEPQKFEWRSKTKLGKVFPSEVTLKKIKLRGKPVILAVVKDIAEKERTKQKIQESENIINESPIVVFLWKNEENWPVEYVSKNVEKLLGYSSEEFLSGKTAFSKAVHKDDIKQVEKEVEEYSKHDNIKEFTQTYRIVTKQGTVKWIEDRTIIRRNEKGKITHYQGIVFDVSEKKEAEERIKESEKHLNQIVDQIGAGVALIRAKDHKITYVNPYAAKLIGLPKEQIEGKVCHNFICPAECGKCPITDLCQKVDNTEKVVINAKKEQIPVLKTAKTMKIDNEDYIIDSFVDIRKTKAQELELKKFRQAMEESPAFMIMTDIDGNIEYVNPAFRKATGYELEDVRGKTPRILKSGHTSKEEYERLWKKITSGESWEGELKNKKKDGGYYWAYAHISPVKDENGKIKNFLGIQEDITKRKEAEEKLKQRFEDLERFQNLTVNRELRMIELKKEINKLRKEEKYKIVK